MSTGMPQGIWLNKFGSIIADAFGKIPYQVGSSLAGKDWRDVDVRLILNDEEYDLMFGRPDNELNTKLAAFTLAFSALGKAMTGLPIDFQIQKQSHANEKFGLKNHPRSALIECQPTF